MVRVSTNITALLVTLLLLGTIAYGQGQNWPLKRTIDLSSGFGDFRANRFHAGVDLRTGGAVGAKIYSPVEGHIWRVKMSYRGYGKGLYVKGNNGHFYVFAHLSRFNKTIQSAVLNHQFERERYYVDIYFPSDSIPVKKGELIAYSGQTGIGAPHLHFEKRSPDNVPINPLSHGFELSDKVPPTFERIGFQLLDKHSLFAGGRRKMFLPVTRVAPGRYRLDSVLHINAPFGVLTHCYDQKRAGGMRQAVKKLTVEIDTSVVYESDLDSLPFENGPMVNLEYDVVEAANNEKRVRSLFRKIRSCSVMRRPAPGSGWVGLNGDLADGLHTGRVTAYDMSGNETTLDFRFVVGSEELNARDTALNSTNNAAPKITASIVSDGLAVRVEGLSQTADLTPIFLYCGDRFVAEYPIQRVSGSTAHFAFVPVDDCHQCITRIRVVVPDHNGEMMTIDQPVGFAALGFEGEEVWGADDQFSVQTGNQNLFRPTFAWCGPVDPPYSVGTAYASKVYQILPEAFLVRKEFKVSIELDPGLAANKHTGLCWYDKKEREWVWIDKETENEDLTAGGSLGGGLFAAVIDTTGPTIRKLNLKRGHKYWNRQPRVKCVIEDNLSGFADDLNIDVRIDGEYILSELDFESGEFVGRMRKPLSLGGHELIIAVVDRAGNRTERKVNFEVIKKP